MIIDIFNTDKKYKVILCDPPWTFKTYSDKGKGRSAEQHYETMTFTDICELPIKKLANPDGCCVFLWITDPLLEKGFKVLKSWGFTYKTVGFYWAKVNKTANLESLNSNKDFFMGTGYYTRANPEQCLFGTSGRKNPLVVNRGIRKLIVAKRREHSRKPDETIKRIDLLLGTEIPKLELFARQEREGWDSFGNEVNKYENS